MRWQYAALFSLALAACSGDDTAGQSTETSSTNSASASETNTSEAETGTSGTETGETGVEDCYAGMHAIVTDIDETLTTSDGEFLMQLADSTYDPLERAEAHDLINDYHARGYTIVYLTARSDAQQSVDNMTPASVLTQEWLVAHGFPTDEHTRLILAPSFVFGDTAAQYKGEALIELQGEGFMFDYAYGNAVSDISGYDMAGIPKDVTFIIGPEGGMDGTVAVPEDDWVTHRAMQIPMVTDYCG